jgi:hypothetical protein
VHPGPASIDCNDCAKHVYNLQTGEVETFEIEDGKRLPILRTGPTPCDSCPKGSPENGRKLELDWRNRRAVDLYHRMRSTPGARLPKHLEDCTVTQRNFYLIENTIRAATAELKARIYEEAKAEGEKEHGR